MSPLLEPSIADLAAQVRDDARAAVSAEVTAWKALVAFRTSGLKIGVPLLIGALFLLQAVLTALLVGLILALSPLIGAGWSTLAVIVLGLALVGLLAWLGVRSCATLTTPLPEDAK